MEKNSWMRVANARDSAGPQILAEKILRMIPNL